MYEELKNLRNDKHVIIISEGEYAGFSYDET